MLVSPFIPAAKSGGRKHTTDMREVVNGQLYIASSGCAWRMLPKCFPPVSTVRRYFYAWRNSGLFASINPGEKTSALDVADKGGKGHSKPDPAIDMGRQSVPAQPVMPVREKFKALQL